MRTQATRWGSGPAVALVAVLATIATAIGPACATDAAPPAPTTPMSRPESRIVGGTPAAQGAWPSQVALIDRTRGTTYQGQFCGGTVIDRSWILTAAHCFHTSDGRPLQTGDLWAAVGRDRLRGASDRAQIRVDRIVVHPGFDPASQADDLALVRLDKIAGPIVAVPAVGPWPDQATILGYGSFYEGRLAGRALTPRGGPAAQTSDRLRRADVRLIDPGQCADRADTGEAWIGPDLICAAAEPEEACAGDSGGPLVAESASGNDRLIGTLSFGSGCAVDAPVAIYTPVGAYSDWIAATLALD